MSRHPIMLVIMVLCSAIFLIAPRPGLADPFAPNAPASMSWLPHGYGNTMHVVNTPISNFKGLHGFRPAPEYIGSWSHPLWGWDVNGFYQGPQVPEPDPGKCQLPVGLIYPSASPPPPMASNGPMPPRMPEPGPMPLSSH
ncbi:MAG TPA: hypothetical protein VK463_16190 [Desulfomonilaceae bacterium]|nr:hypothetical protein [Desulfomonilaceae bacterium]